MRTKPAPFRTLEPFFIADVTNPGDANSHPSAPPPPSGELPSITSQPESQTVTAGADVTFTVVATGPGSLSYQWRRNGADIGGATEPVLVLPGVTKLDSGRYTVVVSNEFGSLTSATASLRVRRPHAPKPAAAAPPGADGP